MKPTARFFFLALLAALWLPRPALAASREAQWKAVEEAISKGLPRTAITNLEPIIAGALGDKAFGEAARAIARKIVLEGNIQGNKPEEKITRMEAEISKAPKEIVPLLDTILANWYWHYFQNNRWRFMQRTATAQAPGKDFTTWDLPRLFAEIDKQFTSALANSDTLKKTPVSDFDDLIQKGTMPDAYRPTLYDFIAHEALQFYSSGEQAATKAEDAFELFADAPVYGVVPVFGPADAFMAGKVERRADESAVEKAFFLYRDLLTFHRDDKDPTAFANADLERLAWAYNTAFGEDKAARYKAALKLFTEKWADSEVSAVALHHWGRVLQQEGDLVEARTLAQRGENSFRNSIGGRMCHNLIEEIEARSLAVTTERVWNCGAGISTGQNGQETCPTLTVRYRNVTNVYLRAVAWDWSDFLDKGRNRPESLNDQERGELLAKAPALAWSTNLVPTADFKERVVELAAPDSLKPGFYFLIASSKPDFSANDNQVTYADFWVSDLALIVRSRSGDIEGFVLEANSGEPVNGAQVASWYLDNNGNRVAVAPVTTDENGFFSAGATEGRGHLIRVRHNGRQLASQQDYWAYRQQPDRETRRQTIFFTDRALYRPGQTVQYKGIVLEVNQEKDNYEVLPGRRITVVFADPNGKEIAKAEHRCNDYGSFTGSFTAPRDRLMGRHRIYVSSGEHGNASFNVEEYKRPKFQVTLEAPKIAAKLNDRVMLTGKAEAYTGAAIDGAKMKWRVVREVRWPYWWGWYWRPTPRAQGSQEIAHGTATTGADGTFRIEFVAKPDPSVSEKDEASFTFSIHTDVTDAAGETRSAQRSINVGFTALQATLDAADWQTENKPVVLNIRTTTLDGEAQAAEGTVKVYRLKEPARVRRAPLSGPRYWRGAGQADDTTPDLSNPNNWDLGEVAAEQGFTTDADGNAKLEFSLGSGAYRAMLDTQDRFRKKVTARLPIQVLKPDDSRLAIRIPNLLAGPGWSLEPGQEFMALWGTGYDAGRAFIEVEHRGRMLQRFWTKPGATQQQIKQAITEAMRGGFFVHVTQVRENRAYINSRRIDVPWSNKELDVKWEHLVSKLQPGQKETWTAVISLPAAGGDGNRLTNSSTRAGRGKDQRLVTPVTTTERTVAEMVATLYDESLDQFLPLHWPSRFGIFRQDWSSFSPDFANTLRQLQYLKGQWSSDYENVSMTYRHFPADLVANLWGYEFGRREKLSIMRGVTDQVSLGAPAEAAAAPAPMELAQTKSQDAYANGDLRKDTSARGRTAREPTEPAATKGPDLSQVSARRNLNETAFFFPQLTSDSNGVVRMTFTMTEALTQWRFLGFAHDKQVRSGFLEGKAVTAKDLMVQPNAPRFVREGDVIEFTVKVSNQSAARQQGNVRLTFTSAQSEQNADSLLGNSSPERSFDIPARESRSYSWRVKVPDGAPFLIYKTVASTGRVSDGEEGYLPVLSRRIFVTESLPLPIRGRDGGPVTKKFQFAKLLASGRSKTLVNQNLVVQMVSNPSWYAVLALPYLMEYPYECTEQTFNRFYANSLARFIANSDPKIRRVFDQWKGTPALDSPLEKNQDLKSVILEETPWLRQANAESQARKNVGILFDANRLDNEAEGTLARLTETQLSDGSWPWFPGGRGDDYITLYITTGFGRMRHLGADAKVDAALRALNRLDNWMREKYERIQMWPHPEEYVPGATDALYLYGRSFFLKDRPIAAPNRKAVDFFLAQSRKHWLKVANRQSQGHLALALRRFNASTHVNDPTPLDIMRSIKERSVTSEELGMFWRDTELSWWWYRAPIETQALMIEAFDEVTSDPQAVEECRVWLLKQKQTQDWKTTKATADAVYALLLRGRDILSSDALVEVTVGAKSVTPAGSPQPSARGEGGRNVEAGTGFYEVRFAGSDIKPRMGEITVKKLDPGVAWGSVHWQYLEDMSKVTPHEGTPLKLKKSLYTRTNTKKGPVLEPVKGEVQVGDELVVRIELRVDRDMEYVHLKDQRGSGTEPVNVISRYKYQDGLAYYESTRDTASHFFIDYLPKGTYVFEYATRVQLRGKYQTGVAEIQCMYAPEFNSHSEGLTLVVK